MTLTTPLALILLLLIVPVAYTGWPRYRYRRARDTASLILRSVMITLLVLALAGLQTVQSSNRLAVIFLVDVSDSMGSAAQDAAYAYIRESLTSMGTDDVAGIVVFGAEAQVGRSLSAARELAPVRAAPGTGNTDLAAAIRLGLALLPTDAARRLVVLSDGLETTGSAESAAQIAAAAGVEISYVPFVRQPTPEVQVRDVIVPSVLSENQQFDLVVTITAEQATPAQVTVLAAGEIVHTETLNLRQGTSSYTLPLVAGQAGFRDFLVQVQPQEADGFYQNNQMGAFTRVEGDPRVLVVASDPDEIRYLVPALEESGLTVDVIAPGRLPIGIAPLAQYDTVLLANVSAAQLSVGRMETLESYVGDLGGGLVVIGGPDAYGPGGYFRTPLEDALPVEMQIRDQQRLPRLTIAYLIDRSGSMGALSPRGIPFIDLAKEAIIRSIGFLQSTDRAAVASFDFNAYWLAEFQDIVNGEELQRLVASLRASGGTSIRAGMQLVAEDIVNEPSEIKHIIVLTDGGADSTGLVDMARDLYEQNNVTTSIVSIGDFQPPFLPEMARAGGGNFHHIIDVDNIPSIFTLETVLASRSYIIEETFTPTATAISASSLHPIIRGISALPQMRGYIATTPRAAAQVILRGPDDYNDPVLAVWQYGLGRSVAFTSDATARWGQDWVTWEDFARFWSQAVRWTLTEGAAANLETQVIMEDARARIVVDARDDAGAFLNGLVMDSRVVFDPEQPAARIPLQQVAPGRYEGTFTPLGEGAHFVRVTSAATDTRPQLSQTVGWVMTYSAEYDIRPSSASVLPQIASLTGGRSLQGRAPEVFTRNIAAVRASAPLWPWLLLAVALLLPLDVAVRRLVVTRSDMRRLRVYLRGDSGAPESDAERMTSLLGARDRVRQRVAAGPAAPSAPSPAPGGISALKQRRKDARAAVEGAAVEGAAVENPSSAPASSASGPRYSAPKSAAPPASPTSEGNIGARLLKKRRGEDEEKSS